jgi:hypothetical protein
VESTDKSTWESQEAFDARMAERRRHFVAPTPLRVWYHVAAIGNYRDVVREHAAIFSAVGLDPTACVVGNRAGANHVRSIMPVVYHSESVQEYETATLQRLWQHCCKNPTGSVLYAHTKGVSAPNDPGKAAWRRLMDRHVIGNWRENLQKLALYDMVGVDWQDSETHPHFSGNFWMARADWIARLDSPETHRAKGGPSIVGQPWDRMHAEMWLGSRAYHHVESLCCRNVVLWPGECVFPFLGNSYRPWI